MRTRFSIDEDGIFRSRHGDELGKIVAVTLDLVPNALDMVHVNVRAQVWARAMGQCEHCGYDGKLQEHHTTYERLGHELAEDLLLLCANCHKAEHERLEEAGTPLVRPKGGDATGDYRGGLFSSTTTAGENSEGNESQGVVRGNEINALWAHYVALFNATRQTLNSTRRRVIRQALKVRSFDECKRAIDGLRVSPYHNGENEQQQTYLDIRYALKGNSQRGESNEERIDKMVALAPLGDGVGDHGLTSHQVRVLVDRVRYTAQTGGEPDRGRAAWRSLTDAGFNIKREGERVWIEEGTG